MTKDFERRAIARLRHGFPALTSPVDDERIRAFVRMGVERAATHALVGESDVLRYLVYMLSYGPEFDTDPRFAWAAEILHREDLDPTGRLDLIDAYDTFRMNRG